MAVLRIYAWLFTQELTEFGGQYGLSQIEPRLVALTATALSTVQSLWSPILPPFPFFFSDIFCAQDLDQ